MSIPFSYISFVFKLQNSFLLLSTAQTFRTHSLCKFTLFPPTQAPLCAPFLLSE